MAVALDENTKIFVIHIIALLVILVDLSCLALIRLLLANKALIKILLKYLNYVDIFLFGLIIELFENIDMNEYAIKLVENK